MLDVFCSAADAAGRLLNEAERKPLGVLLPLDFFFQNASFASASLDAAAALAEAEAEVGDVADEEDCSGGDCEGGLAVDRAAGRWGDAGSSLPLSFLAFSSDSSLLEPLVDAEAEAEAEVSASAGGGGKLSLVSAPLEDIAERRTRRREGRGGGETWETADSVFTAQLTAGSPTAACTNSPHAHDTAPSTGGCGPELVEHGGERRRARRDDLKEVVSGGCGVGQNALQSDADAVSVATSRRRVRRSAVKWRARGTVAVDDNVATQSTPSPCPCGLAAAGVESSWSRCSVGVLEVWRQQQQQQQQDEAGWRE